MAGDKLRMTFCIAPSSVASRGTNTSIAVTGEGGEGEGEVGEGEGGGGGGGGGGEEKLGSMKPGDSAAKS